MSGQLKEVRTRIQSVISTQQITKAMKVVSAAKLRKAQEAIVRMRPYSLKLSELLSNLVASLQGDLEIEYAREKEVNNVLIVLITSDRGLCGGFNSNLIKLARTLIEKKYQGKQITLLFLGSKGYRVFKKFEFATHTDYMDIFSDLTFEKAAEAATYIMDSYTKGEYDHVDLVYSQFKNAATQTFTAEQFLPIAKIEPAEGEEESNNKVDFIFEPDKKDIIKHLIPKILKTQLFKALLDSNASEHGARMTAMDKATENANELLRDLKISYNRARQAAITTELTEIVSGAAALEGS